MSNLDAIKSLWERAKASNHNTESLTALLADYSQVLGTVTGSNEEYKVSLRRLREELPDLQRLVTKKHDPILKGRLQDAIGGLKRKVEEVEAPPPATEAGVPDAGEMTIAIEGQEEAPKRPFRNMPTLGMD